jgi:hypothetical protein
MGENVLRRQTKQFRRTNNGGQSFEKSIRYVIEAIQYKLSCTYLSFYVHLRGDGRARIMGGDSLSLAEEVIITVMMGVGSRLWYLGRMRSIRMDSP